MQARKKVSQWPEPYRSYATCNIIDAIDDLARWYDHRKEILTDMTEAIIAWEQEMKDSDGR